VQDIKRTAHKIVMSKFNTFTFSNNNNLSILHTQKKRKFRTKSIPHSDDKILIFPCKLYD